jgi:hypothetical protein
VTSGSRRAVGPGLGISAALNAAALLLGLAMPSVSAAKLRAPSPGSLLGSGKRAFRRLYGLFGDSWRIRQRQSLFNYRRGRTTRSYTRLRFPSRRLTVGSLPRALRRRAARICRAAGVTDPRRHDLHLAWRRERHLPQDLGDFARGFPLDLARDANGRAWLAWETNAMPNELYMGELDPATGEPAPGATRQRAPVLHLERPILLPGGAGGLALPGRFVLAVDWFDDDVSVAWATVVPDG